MRPILFALATCLLFSCSPDDTPVPSNNNNNNNTPTHTRCDTSLLDGLHILGWDQTVDTVTIKAYPLGANFTGNYGTISGHTVGVDGKVHFIFDYFSEYEVVLHSHNRTYRIKNITYGPDSVTNAELANDPEGICFTSISAVVNDSVYSTPISFDDMYPWLIPVVY